MNATARIADGALPPAEPPHAVPGAGAVVVFEGVVRGHEGGARIAALEYATYDPMALKQLQVLADDIARGHGLLALRAEHSRGRVPVGACSFRLVVHAAHRAEALAAIGEFVDRLKRDVPIWKTAAAS